jgi:hypothetical protein
MNTMLKPFALISISALAGLANATNTQPVSVHVSLRLESEQARSSIQHLHDTCLTMSGQAPSPQDESLLKQPFVHNIEDYFAYGKHARYDTVRKLELDHKTCRVIDSGEVTTIAIEDGVHRIQVDLSKNRALRYTQHGSSDPGMHLDTGGTVQHLTFAGASCTTSPETHLGTKVCLWDTQPFYSLANGHQAPIQLMSDMTIQGQNITHTEATAIRTDEVIPASKFEVPAGIEIKGQAE